jgi:hypothetical protein
MELNLGILLTLKEGSATQHTFQNYRLSADVTYDGVIYTFAPFSFSGVVSNMQGDNLDSGLVFPANALTRAWADEAISKGWLGFVKVMLLDDASNPVRPLYSYAGAITGGGWSQEGVQLQLNTIMDAVRGSIPGRKMNHQLVGNIPISAALRV